MANPEIDTTDGDVTPPPAPMSIIVTAYGKGLMVSVLLVEGLDFLEYEFWKKVGAGGTYAMFAHGRISSMVDLDTAYGTTYFYKARGVDTSGNVGAFGTAEASGTPAQMATGDIGSGAVQTINIAAGSVVTLNIAAGAVVTSNIAANAVSSVAASSAISVAGPIFTPTFTSVIPNLTVGITTQGGPVLVVYSLEIIKTNTDASVQVVGALFTVRRDGATLGGGINSKSAQAGLPAPLNTTNEIQSYTLVDIPPAGFHTYDVTWWPSTSGVNATFYAGTRFIEAIEFKR